MWITFLGGMGVWKKKHREHELGPQEYLCALCGKKI